MVASHERDGERGRHVSLVAEAPPAAGTIKVVVADDAATARLVLRRILETSEVFTVVGEAADGLEAVALCAELQPDLVLVDLAMPEMDGLQAIPMIRQRAPGTRVVAVSGFTAHRMAVPAVAAGASAFVEKTDSPDDLVARLVAVHRGPAPAPATAGIEPPRALERAREAEQRFRLAFEHAPIGMAVVGLDDRFLEVNPALCAMAGVAEVDLLGRPMGALSHPDDRHPAAAARRGLIDGGEVSDTIETRLVRPDGRVVWALVSASVARDGAGRPSHLVAQVVDISRQKQAEAELTRSNADLSSFAYLAAHELKAPLQSVSGFASLLERLHGPALDPQARELVRWIVDGSGRMNALIEDLLTYCSVDAAEPVMVDVALDELVGEVVSALEADIAAAGAEVAAGRLPVVTGDPLQLRQLVHNLVANALKFVEPGRGPRVHVSAEPALDGWTVTVADNGIGVTEEHEDRIFAMFERLHPRERYSGTGIGLAICKRIVERRGGSIWVEPNQGSGSRFRFFLPDPDGGP